MCLHVVMETNCRCELDQQGATIIATFKGAKRCRESKKFVKKFPGRANQQIVAGFKVKINKCNIPVTSGHALCLLMLT